MLKSAFRGRPQSIILLCVKIQNPTYLFLVNLDGQYYDILQQQEKLLVHICYNRLEPLDQLKNAVHLAEIALLQPLAQEHLDYQGCLLDAAAFLVGIYAEVLLEPADPALEVFEGTCNEDDILVGVFLDVKEVAHHASVYYPLIVRVFVESFDALHLFENAVVGKICAFS